MSNSFEPRRTANNQDDDDEKLFDQLYGGTYFKGVDFPTDKEQYEYRVIDVDVQQLRSADGNMKPKYVLVLEGTPKKVAMNKGNATRMAEAFGKPRRNWIGQIVRLSGIDTNTGRGVLVSPLRPGGGAATTAAAIPASPSGGGAVAAELNDGIPFSAEKR